MISKSQRKPKSIASIVLALPARCSSPAMGGAVDGDPLDALVGAFLNDAIESPTRYIADRGKGRDLVERVRTSGAEGVVFCAPSFCDPALLDQPLAPRAVDAAGVQWNAFKYAENSGQFQVIREQAGTFADSIKLWTGAA